MNRWQFAWLTDQPYTTIGFSHPQPGLAAELATVLGQGVFIQQSTEWAISLDRARVNLGYVSGLLGDRGWEMFAVETRLQPNAMTPSQMQTNWYFKRPAPEGSSAGMSMSTAAQTPAVPAQPAPAADTTQMSAQAAAPVFSPEPAPAAPMTTPPMASPAGPEQATAPAAPAAPAGPAAPQAAPGTPWTPPTEGQGG